MLAICFALPLFVKSQLREEMLCGHALLLLLAHVFAVFGVYRAVYHTSNEHCVVHQRGQTVTVMPELAAVVMESWRGLALVPPQVSMGVRNFGIRRASPVEHVKVAHRLCCPHR